MSVKTNKNMLVVIINQLISDASDILDFNHVPFYSSKRAMVYPFEIEIIAAMARVDAKKVRLDDKLHFRYQMLDVLARKNPSKFRKDLRTSGLHQALEASMGILTERYSERFDSLRQVLNTMIGEEGVQSAGLDLFETLNPKVSGRDNLFNSIYIYFFIIELFARVSNNGNDIDALIRYWEQYDINLR